MIRASLLLIAGLLVTGCAGAHELPLGRALSQSVESITARDYERVRQRWTRSDRVYRDLQTQLFISATFHTPAFRRAFAVTFSEIYGQGGQVTRQELVTLAEGIEGYLNFFVSMYTPDLKDNDLDKADSIWGLRLSNEVGVAVRPAEIVRVKIDSNIRAVYPNVGEFDRAYIVRFPLADRDGQPVLTETTSSLTLHIASALNKGALVWGVPSASTP